MLLVWGNRVVFMAEQRVVVLSSQPKWPHGRGHNFSVLFHCNISAICCLLSFSLIIPSSPDFGCIYLLFPHPFILLPLSFTFNPHPFIPSSLHPEFLLHRPMFVRTERGSRFSGITLCVMMRYTEWWFLECFY